jgi:hypothetical protein
VESNLEPLSPAWRQKVIELVGKHGHYEGTAQGCRVQITEITNPRHCIAWKLRLKGRWHAGYAATVDEARVRMNALMLKELTRREDGAEQRQLFS